MLNVVGRFADALAAGGNEQLETEGWAEAEKRLPLDIELIAVLSARRALTKHRNESAFAMLRDKIEPRQYPSLYWLTMGDLLMLQHRYQEAASAFRVLSQYDPSSALPHARLGQAMMGMRAYPAAIESFSQAILKDSEKLAHRVGRALAYEAAGRHQECFEDLNECIRQQPHSARLLLIRSRVRRAVGDSEAAEADYLEAIRHEPQTFEDWVSRGLARAMENPQAAVEDLHQALALRPNSTIVFQNLAYLHSEHLHDYSKAIDYLNRILEQAPNDELARSGRAVLLARQGKVQRALDDVKFFEMAQSPLLPSTYYQIACVHALLAGHHPPSLTQAIHYLKQSFQKGYGTDLFKEDPDLDGIRDNPLFQELILWSQ